MKTLNTKVELSKLLPVLFGFYVMGFVDIIGAATKYAKDDFALSNTIANLLPFMVFVWFFILSIPTGVLQDKIGRRKASCIGIALTGVGMLVPLVFYSFETVIAGFILLGIGNTIVQVSLNPLMLFVSPPDKYSGFLSLSQFVKSIASLFGPIITTAFFIKTANWKYVFLVYAILSVISLVWLYLTPIYEVAQEKTRATFKSSFNLLVSNYFVLLMVLGIFLVVGIDVGMNICIPDYMNVKFALSREAATNIISVYFTAKMLGTLLGSYLLIKLSNKMFFVGTANLALISIVLIPFVSSALLVKILIFLVALGTSNIFPLIFSLTVQRIPERSNELSGLMIMAVSGGALIPVLMGIVVDSMGINGNIFVLMLCACYLLVLSLIIAMKKR